MCVNVKHRFVPLLTSTGGGSFEAGAVSGAYIPVRLRPAAVAVTKDEKERVCWEGAAEPDRDGDGSSESDGSGSKAKTGAEAVRGRGAAGAGEEKEGTDGDSGLAVCLCFEGGPGTIGTVKVRTHACVMWDVCCVSVEARQRLIDG